jgi:glycosyltransferase involved in cell wall biosynthesis
VSRRSEIKVFYKPRNQVLLALRCYPWPRAIAYLTPRIVKGLLEGLRTRSLGEWWRAMQSAAALGPQCLEDRREIAPATWRRIAGMRVQSAPPLGAETKTTRGSACRMSHHHRRKVLLIAPYFDRNQPGESWSTYQWVAGISAYCEVTVLTCHKPGWEPAGSPTGAAQLVEWSEARLPGMRGRLAWELKPGYGIFYFQARRWIKEARRRGEHFDLVHQINPLALRYPSPAHDLGIPWIVGPLAGSLPTPPELAAASRERVWFRKLRGLDQLRLRRDPWLRATYAKAAAVIGVAPYVGELLASCPPARFEIMAETGVEVVAEVAKVPPAPGSPLRLLFVGRIIRTKGILDAIRAIAKVGRRGLVRLDVVGDGDLLEACRREAATLGLADQVTFHGRLSRSEVFDFYGRSHVFLFPSFREPSGNVVFEAMSQGLPVIACDYGGPGYVVDSSCGLKVAPSHPDDFASQLAERIVLLANQPDLFAALSAGALKRMRKIALWPTKIEAMLELYEDLIAPKMAVPASETLLKEACENE